MILDTSAIFAMIAQESDAREIESAILSADVLEISAVTALETRIVLNGRFGVAGGREFDAWLIASGVTIVPFDREQSAEAFEAFKLYGKGQGHPAQLNICDCASYALAKVRGDALLFKGNDFSRTDIVAAL